MKNNNASFDKVRSVFFFSLLILLGLGVIYLIRPFLYPIFWAAIVAILFTPAYIFFTRHLKNKNISAILTVILVIAILFLPLTGLGLAVFNESIDLYYSASNTDWGAQVEGLAKRLDNTRLEPLIIKIQNDWPQYATTIARGVSAFLFNSLKSFTQNSLRFFLLFFLMLYSLFYFLRDGQEIIKRLIRLSPLGDKYEKMLSEKFTSTARATIKGNLFVGVIQGVLGGLVFWITGINGALIWAIIMIFLSLIPAVGSFLIWLPAGVIMLATGHTWEGATILIVGTLLISTIDNLLRPLLVGKDIQLHPLVILFTTLGGLMMFGISGFVIGPVLASLFFAVMSIYEHHYQHQLDHN
ncbi:MAG TPA: AI-2E family transporter [Patescibacteria group bacterium]|nr:AI-2E family transporter [Patescibacteria group bacterium]